VTATRRGVIAGVMLILATLPVRASQEVADLPDLGPAADFTLTDETGRSVSRSAFDGSVVLVSFIFTRCTDVCPLLSSKLADIADDLAAEGRNFHFVTVTVDPRNDTPEVLKDYAENIGYDPGRWSFLTGTTQDVVAVARDYGVFMTADPHSTIHHSLVTTLVDRQGRMRVQYLGEKFDTLELLADLRALTE
jgi:protein SCO1/2